MSNAAIFRLAGVIGFAAFIIALEPLKPPRPRDAPAPRTWSEITAEAERINAELIETPANIQNWRRLGELFALWRNTDEAIEWWTANAPPDLVNDFAGEALVWYWAGRIRPGGDPDPRSQAAWRKCIALLDRFIQEKPHLATVEHWHFRAWASVWINDTDQAAESFRKVMVALVEAESTHDPRWLRNIWVQVRRGAEEVRSREMIHQSLFGLLETMKRIGPGEGRDDPSWFALGRDASDAGATEVALEAFSFVEADLLNSTLESRSDRDATWRLGWEFRKLGDLQRAQTHWRRLAPALEQRAEENPRDSNAWLSLAAVLAVGDQPERALDALERAVAEGLRSVDALISNESFDSLRDDQRFPAILEGARRNVEERRDRLHEQGLSVP